MSTLTKENVQRFREGRMKIIWLDTEVDAECKQKIPASLMWNSLIKEIKFKGDQLIIDFYMVAEYQNDKSFKLVNTPDYKRSQIQLDNFEEVVPELPKCHVMLSRCKSVYLAFFEPTDPSGV